MKKTNLLITILTVLAVFGCQIGLAFATGLDLDPNIYKPDLGDASVAGGPIVAAINFIIAFIGVIILAWGVVTLIKDHGLKLLTGKRSLKDQDLQAKLIGFIAGAVLIILAVTGSWFKVLMYIWSIVQKILDKLTGF